MFKSLQATHTRIN